MLRLAGALVCLSLGMGCSDQTPGAPGLPALPGRVVPTEVLAPQSYHLTLADLPAPYATASAQKGPTVVGVPAHPALRVPEGFVVNVYADGFDGPRWMTLTPEGDVLLVESRQNRIRRLRDTDGDGVADVDETFATAANGLDQPFGMAFAGGAFFVGNTGEVRRYAHTPGQPLQGTGTRIAELTPGGYNQHWTRNVVAAPDGQALYVSVGSESNAREEELPRASIQQMHLDGSNRATYASGLRNPVGLAFHPTTGALYTTVNERDGLGDDLVPDYFTRVEKGAFYGWPYAYLAPENLDPRHVQGGQSTRPALAAQTVTPQVLFEAHSAALGVQFYDGQQFPRKYRSGAFVAFRGSWNRSTGTGYKVVFVPFGADGQPTGAYEDFLTGFLLDPAVPTTFARPVGLLVLPDGSLLLAEDGLGVVYRISYHG